MKKLQSYISYGFVETPVVRLCNYAINKNLYVKLESENLNGNIKSRTAYFLIQDLLQKATVKNIVESSSGNLGLSLGYFAQKADINFLCLVDPTVQKSKIKQLEENNIQYESVSLDHFSDYRSARIAYAQHLDQKLDWIWTNQYDNAANEQAHYTTTGEELYRQMNGEIDYFVCSVGSGGTISGISRCLKEKDKNIKIIAVEPSGSTIFGGNPGEYITAGAGLTEPSGIIRRNWELLDYSVKVDDLCAIQTCQEILQMERISVGITSGAALFAGRYIAYKHPDKRIACISPDSGRPYESIIKSHRYKSTNKKPEIIKNSMRRPAMKSQA